MTPLTKVIGDEKDRPSKYNPGLAERINREVELEDNRKEIDIRIKGNQVIEPTKLYLPIRNAIKRSELIYLPSVGIYISKQRTFMGNWYEAHKVLANNGSFMPTVYQFKEFLRYLKEYPQGVDDAKRSEITKILDEILTGKDLLNSEWLDTKFEFTVPLKPIYALNKPLVHYNHRFSNGQLQAEKSETLEDYLTADQRLDISLEDWLENANKHGLPKTDARAGELEYWGPRYNLTVASFSTSPYAPHDITLYCNRDPSGNSKTTGVREAYKEDKLKAILEAE